MSHGKIRVALHDGRMFDLNRGKLLENVVEVADILAQGVYPVKDILLG